MNISLFFGMRVWGFTSLCWPFWHTVSELVYFWIFGVFVSKGQMGFNFGIFPEFGVFTSFCVPPYFLGFSWHKLSHGPRSSIWMSVKLLLHFCVALGCVLHPYSRLGVQLSDLLPIILVSLDLCFCSVDTRIHVESILSD